MSSIIRGWCISRNLFRFPSREDLDKAGFNQSWKTAMPSLRLRKRRILSRMLNLEFAFLQRTFLTRYYCVDNVWHYVTSGSQGNVLGASPISSPPKGGEHQKFKRFWIDGVNRYECRIKRLQYVLHTIVENGISDDAYKKLKRLHLIAFTCNFTQFTRLSRSIALACCKKVTIRNPLVRPKAAYKYPSLTGETKSISKLNGIKIHLWIWKEVLPPKSHLVW